MQTLIFCGMVISVVMLIIGSNIARAFSLVGALSIIRFRNAVKDPSRCGLHLPYHGYRYGDWNGLLPYRHGPDDYLLVLRCCS